MRKVLMMLPREEGLAALWKGHLPAQALSVTYGFARYKTRSANYKLHFSFAAFEAVVPLLGVGDKSLACCDDDRTSGSLAVWLLLSLHLHALQSSFQQQFFYFNQYS